MHDETEAIRRAMIAVQNAIGPSPREQLEAEVGQVWDTAEMTAEFRVLGFMAPMVAVERRADGVKGSLEFQHEPRFYYAWTPH